MTATDHLTPPSTLRDEIALSALAAIIIQGDRRSAAALAERAYSLADQMLKVRRLPAAHSQEFYKNHRSSGEITPTTIIHVQGDYNE